jgi:hypothetical protein
LPVTGLFRRLVGVGSCNCLTSWLNRSRATRHTRQGLSTTRRDRSPWTASIRKIRALRIKKYQIQIVRATAANLPCLTDLTCTIVRAAILSLAGSHLIHQPETRTRSFISVEQLNHGLTLSPLSSSCSYKQVPLAGG